jgi:hypothetical protein
MRKGGSLAVVPRVASPQVPSAPSPSDLVMMEGGAVPTAIARVAPLITTMVVAATSSSSVVMLLTSWTKTPSCGRKSPPSLHATRPALTGCPPSRDCHRPLPRGSPGSRRLHLKCTAGPPSPVLCWTTSWTTRRRPCLASSSLCPDRAALTFCGAGFLGGYHQGRRQGRREAESARA